MSENTTIARFCDKGTLTTEEWKAEPELEHDFRIECFTVPVNNELCSLVKQRVKNNLRTSQA